MWLWVVLLTRNHLILDIGQLIHPFRYKSLVVSMDSFLLFLILLFAIPLFLAIFRIVTGLWILYDLGRFTKLRGKMKRGITVGTLPLKAEIYQFLTALPTTTQYRHHFIYRTGQEFIMVEHRPFSLNLIDSIFYIAYTDLSMPERKIEFRMPLSYLVPLIASPVLFSIFWLGILFLIGIAFEFALIWLVPVIFWVLWLGGMFLGHYQAIRRLLKGLDQLIEQGNFQG